MNTEHELKTVESQCSYDFANRQTDNRGTNNRDPISGGNNEGINQVHLKKCS